MQLTAHARRMTLWAFATTTLGTGCIAALAVWVPELRTVLLKEDGLVEMGTAVCLAGVVAAATWGIFAKGPRASFTIALTIGFIEFMDEISFGTRLFGFEPPRLYGGGELDGLHDLLILAFRLVRDFMPNLGWVLLGLVFLVSLSLFAARKMPHRVISGAKSAFAEHVLLVSHVALLGLSQLIDVATTSRTMSAVEEVLELNAAVVLAFYVAQHLTAREARKPGALLTKRAQPPATFG